MKYFINSSHLDIYLNAFMTRRPTVLEQDDFSVLKALAFICLYLMFLCLSKKGSGVEISQDDAILQGVTPL